MELPKLQDFNLHGKTVLVRADLDVPLHETRDTRHETRKKAVADATRLENCLPTIEYLLERDCRVVLLGHLGRPGGKVVPELSLGPVAGKLGEMLGREIRVIREMGEIREEKTAMVENLRFWPGEEANNEGFAKKLALLGDLFVNECFSSSHRQHASFVGIPRFLPHAAGFHLLKEVEILSGVLENPRLPTPERSNGGQARRPVVIVIGGVKEDKLKLIPKFLKIADFILIGGWLLKKTRLCSLSFGGQSDKKIFACLTKDGKDITVESANHLGEIISRGGTVVWNGPMGVYEDERDIKGTKIIAEAIANSSAFKIAGGGDTETVIDKLGLKDKFDWISSGGGAMLEFLAEGTLPGIEALA